MKTGCLCFILLCCSLISKAQFTAEQIKQNLAGTKWNIVKYETFGLEEDPTEEQKNDQIFLNATDMSFSIIENGKEYQGKWSMLNPAIYIVCKASSGEWSRTYKVMSIGEQEAVIEYKDPDLTKTLYYLSTK